MRPFGREYATGCVILWFYALVFSRNRKMLAQYAHLAQKVARAVCACDRFARNVHLVGSCCRSVRRRQPPRGMVVRKKRVSRDMPMRSREFLCAISSRGASILSIDTPRKAGILPRGRLVRNRKRPERHFRAELGVPAVYISTSGSIGRECASVCTPISLPRWQTWGFWL